MAHDPLKPAWFCSFDEEIYHGPYGSREEAIEMAFFQDDDEQVHTEAKIGPGEPKYLGKMIGAHWLIDQLCETSYETGGEYWADCIPSTKAAIESMDDKLEAMIHQWAREHDVPLVWYEIGKTETVQRTYCSTCNTTDKTIRKCPQCEYTLCCTDCPICEECKEEASSK